jgi:hypothetical protein
VHWHQQHSPFAATDDGDYAAGQEEAAKASGWLSIAAASLDQVVELVMTAQSQNGRIAWQPVPDPLDQALAERSEALDAGSPAPGQAREDRGRRLE